MLTILKKIAALSLVFFSTGLSAQLLDNTSTLNNAGGLLNNNSPASLATSAIQSVLPADSAFALSAYIEAPNTLVLRWEIEDGYYLYRKSLGFMEAGNNLGIPVIPVGIQTEDDFFGAVEVYYEQLLIRIPFDPDSAGNKLSLQLNYQGCAEDNYCYPMQFKELNLEII